MPDDIANGLADDFGRAAPSAVGIDAARVARLLDDVETAGLELHALTIWRDGAVAAEGFRWPYAPHRPRMAHSMTKSVTACAIGLLIDEGRLALCDRVAGFFPEVAVAPGSRAARMTVEDLLTMRSGHGEEVSGAIWRGIRTSWVDEFFRIPIVHDPGTIHVYSSAASYMLSAIVTRVTGETILDYLTPRLFVPLGIRDVRWDIGPDGVNPGGNGITFTLADMMRIAVLHLEGGTWRGRRILPAAWIDAATRAQGAPDYGYHWVIGGDYYAALGVFVQMVLVYPAARTVVGINAAMDESAVLLPHLRRHLPAALAGPGDPAADAALAARLAGWARPAALASTASGDPATFRGTWAVSHNPTGVTGLELAFAGDTLLLTMHDADGAHAVAAPRDGWREQRTTLPGAALHHGYAMADAPTVAGWRWLAPDRIELVLHFVESAFRDTLMISVADTVLTLDRAVNINSASRSWPRLVAPGRA